MMVCETTYIIRTKQPLFNTYVSGVGSGEEGEIHPPHNLNWKGLSPTRDSDLIVRKFSSFLLRIGILIHQSAFCLFGACYFKR